MTLYFSINPDRLAEHFVGFAGRENSITPVWQFSRRWKIHYANPRASFAVDLWRLSSRLLYSRFFSVAKSATCLSRRWWPSASWNCRCWNILGPFRSSTPQLLHVVSFLHAEKEVKIVQILVFQNFFFTLWLITKRKLIEKLGIHWTSYKSYPASIRKWKSRSWEVCNRFVILSNKISFVRKS